MDAKCVIEFHHDYDDTDYCVIHTVSGMANLGSIVSSISVISIVSSGDMGRVTMNNFGAVSTTNISSSCMKNRIPENQIT